MCPYVMRHIDTYVICCEMHAAFIRQKEKEMVLRKETGLLSKGNLQLWSVLWRGRQLDMEFSKYPMPNF